MTRLANFGNIGHCYLFSQETMCEASPKNVTTTHDTLCHYERRLKRLKDIDPPCT